jgi:hypothetical protein
MDDRILLRQYVSERNEEALPNWPVARSTNTACVTSSASAESCVWRRVAAYTMSI